MMAEEGEAEGQAQKLRCSQAEGYSQEKGCSQAEGWHGIIKPLQPSFGQTVGVWGL